MKQLTLIIIIFTICVKPSISQNNDCDKRWEKWAELGEIKFQYFEDSILNKVLNDEKVDAENKKLLKELLWYGKLSWEEKIELSVLDKPLYSFFNLNNLPVGIYTHSFYKCDRNQSGSYTNCKESGYEFNFWEVNNNSELPVFISESTFIQLKEAFDTYVGEHSVYVFSNSSSSQGKLVNFGAYFTECSTYFQYQIENHKINNLLIGSRFGLKLEYVSCPNIDFELKKTSMWDCSDCQFEYEPEVTFAKFPFIDNLFFTYIDTFDPSNQYNYPSRSLVMRMEDGTLVKLWNDSIDLYGCSCL